MKNFTAKKGWVAVIFAVLSFSFVVTPASAASDGWHIKDDPTGGECSLIGVWDTTRKTCTLSQDLSQGVIVDSDNIILDGNGHMITGTGSGNGVDLSGRTGVTLKNLNIEKFTYGIYLNSSDHNILADNTASFNMPIGILLSSSSNNTLTSNTALNNYGGIRVEYGSSNTLTRNTTKLNTASGINVVYSTNNTLASNLLSDNDYGVFLYYSSSNIFTSNTLSSNNYGIIFSSSGNNQIYENNFVTNSTPIDAFGIGNSAFNLTTPIGGNYWSNFDTPAEGCNDVNGDNFCDAPYIFTGGQDNLPWTKKDGWVVSTTPPFTCGTSTVQDADGNTYGTTNVNGQCWMTENLRVGKMVTGITEQTNNGVKEKYCYGDDPANCLTDGGLYQWDEAMQYSTTEGSGGMCPAGWHIPTDAEQFALENYLKNEGTTCDANRNDAWDCDGAGTRMISGTPPGLNFPLGGQRNIDGSFSWRSTYAGIWASSLFGEKAWYRNPGSRSSVYHYAVSKAFGFSVRCIQNSSISPTSHAPVITLYGDNPMTLNVGDIFTDPGAMASDAEDGDITSQIVETGTVDTTTAGTYTRHYNVTDSQGLSAAEVVRTVVVKEKTGWDLFSPSATECLSCSSVEEKFQQFPDGGYGRNVVVVTHGWNSNSDDWVNKMVLDINNEIKRQGKQNEWVVFPWDWRLDTTNASILDGAIWCDGTDCIPDSLPYTAYVMAEGQGIKLGGLLSQFRPKSVHLIAHSAGSNLIQHAVKTLKIMNPTAVIHTTFLDAYNPNPLVPENYGEGSTYAEQFVEAPFDPTDPLPFHRSANIVDPFTMSQLPNATTYDVTMLGDTIYNTLNPIAAHSWPYKYYGLSIPKTDDSGVMIRQGYNPGFLYALESGKFSRLPKTQPGAWCIVTATGNPISLYTCGRTHFEQAIQFSSDFVDALGNNAIIFGDAVIDLGKSTINDGIIFRDATIELGNSTIDFWSKAVTGTVDLVEKATLSAIPGMVQWSLGTTWLLHLGTGSPTWISFDVNVISPVNSLSYEYLFPDTSSNGLFTVFVDGNKIYSRDETLLTHSEVFLETRTLPKTLEPGKHTIIFRLDPLTEHKSEMYIANVRLGMTTVQTEKLPPDTIASVTTSIVSGTLGTNDWYTSPATVALAATDNEGGVGVEKTLYSLDNGDWQAYSSTSPIEISSDGIHALQYYSVDWFGNTEATSTLTVKIDKTAPEVSVAVPANGGEYLLHQNVSADWSASDATSGLLSAMGTTASGALIDTSTAGEKTYEITATDNAGNVTVKTVTYYVRYDYGGILQPINGNGTSIFKFGSTVPVKFQLKDANGNFIASAIAKIYLSKLSEGVYGTEFEADSTSAASTGNQFRYDADGNQYIFNLSTKPLSVGTWQIRIALDDGSSKTVNISLK